MATVVSQFENVLSQLQQQAAPVSAPVVPRPVPAMSKSQTVVTTQKTYKFFQQNKGIVILALLLIVAIVIWGVRAYLLKKAKAKEEEGAEGEEGAEEEFSSFFKDKKPEAAQPSPSAPPLSAPPPQPVRAAIQSMPPRAFVQPSGQPVVPTSAPQQPVPRPQPAQQPFDAVIKLDSSSAIPVAGAPAGGKKQESDERPGAKRGEKESAIPGSDVGGTPKPPPENTAPGGGPPGGGPPAAAAADPQFTPL